MTKTNYQSKMKEQQNQGVLQTLALEKDYYELFNQYCRRTPHHNDMGAILDGFSTEIDLKEIETNLSREFGKIIQEKLETKKISQQQIAVLLSLEPSGFSRRINGQTPFRFVEIFLLCLILEIEL